MAPHRKPKPQCFVVSPIGPNKSDVRKQADQVFKHLIKPALGTRYEVVRGDMMGKPGFITTALIRRIARDALVVADLTDANPNVYYELGLRHSTDKPFVHIARAGTKLPFDVQPVNTVFYDLHDPDVLVDALQELKRQVKAIEQGSEPVESPVSVALGGSTLLRPDGFYTWDLVQTLVGVLSRRIDASYEPDVVLTTSGPGSVAALLRLAGDHRDTPVVTASTFPRGRAPESFTAAAQEAGDLIVSTDKWDVFVPPIISHLPPGSQVLLFDDRVVSGDFRRAITTALSSRELTVRGAALVVSPEARDLVDWFCDERDGHYQFPWGDEHGRR